MINRIHLISLVAWVSVLPAQFLATAPAQASVDLLAQGDVLVAGGAYKRVFELVGVSDYPEDVGTEPEPVETSTVLPELTLASAIDMALANNRNLLLARQAVEMARAGGRGAMAQFLPDLSTTYAYTRTLEANTIEVPNVGEFKISSADTFYWGLTLKYPLYFGGQDIATERAGEAGTRAAELKAEQAEALIRLGVISAYTGILEARAGLEAARKSLDHLDEVLRSTQAHYDAGYVPLSGLLSVQVARSQAQQIVAEMERAVEVAQSALAILIGGEIGDRWTLIPLEFPEYSVPFPLDTLWDWAIAARPEVKELAAQREGVEWQIEAVESARRPRVSFQADISRTGSKPDTSGGGGFSGGTNVQGTIGIWWDLYDFGRMDDLRAPLEEQLALLDIQKADLDTRIQQEVEAAYLNVQTQLGNLGVSREAMAQAQEAFRVAMRRREEGLGLVIEVLDAEATLARTEAGHYHTLYEYYRGLATLARSVGMTAEDLVALINAAGGASKRVFALGGVSTSEDHK